MPKPPRPATATTRTVAQVNQTVLLEVLRRNGSLSRQRLAAESGLSTATVHRLVEALRTSGLVVVEPERAPSSGGRPPQLIRYNAGAQTVLAVALRPRRVVGVVTDLHGRVLHEAERPWAPHWAPTAPANRPPRNSPDHCWPSWTACTAGPRATRAPHAPWWSGCPGRSGTAAPDWWSSRRYWTGPGCGCAPRSRSGWVCRWRSRAMSTWSRWPSSTARRARA